MPRSRSDTSRRSASGGVPVPVVVGVPFVGLLAGVSPLLAAGASLALALAVAAVAGPGGFVAAAAFLSVAVPKAGYVVSGFPIPVMMPVLLLAALLLRWRGAPHAHRRGARLAIAALAWLVYRVVVLVFDGGSLGDGLALTGWFGLPMLLFLVGPAVGSVRGRQGSGWVSRLEAGMFFVCGFSIVQQLFGIESTAVPGITRAVGTDYSAKPLLFAGGSKIPSTYQNGNVLGVVTAFFFLVAAERVLGGRGRRRDGFVMAATAAATLLSGSRTVVAGLAIGFAFLVLRSGLTHRTIAVFALGAAVLVGVLQLSPALADRILGTTASDPALALRTEGWTNVLRTMPVGELVVGGPVWSQQKADPGQSEGLVGAIQQVGVIGMVLFVGVFFAATNAPELRRWRFVLLPLAVSLVADSAYLVFPTMFLPIARMFAPLRTEADAPVEDTEDLALAPPVPV